MIVLSVYEVLMQAWTNFNFHLAWPLEIDFSEISFEMQTFSMHIHILMVSCQKGPTRHAYTWQIGPFWQDTLDI